MNAFVAATCITMISFAVAITVIIVMRIHSLLWSFVNMISILILITLTVAVVMLTIIIISMHMPQSFEHRKLRRNGPSPSPTWPLVWPSCQCIT